MKKSNALVPSTTTLEDRLALSGTTAWVAPAPAAATSTPVLISSCPPPSPTAAEVVVAASMQADMSTFDAGYDSAVENILLAPNSAGNINPVINRAGFNGQVSALLSTLQTSLFADVAPLSNSLALDYDIHNMIYGSGLATTSLQSALTALPTPLSTSTCGFTAFEDTGLADVAIVDANFTSDILGYGQITVY